MSELRDAIADEVVTSSNQAAYQTADRVLACDEMQAIRKALRALAGIGARDLDHSRFILSDDLSLPASVVAWVLEGEQ